MARKNKAVRTAYIVERDGVRETVEITRGAVSASIVSSVIALHYVGADSENYWIVSDARPVSDLDGTITTVPDNQFDSVKSRFLNAARSPSALQLIQLLVELGVPCVSENVAEIVMRSDSHYRGSIADWVYAKDMSSFKALVRIGRENKDRIILPTFIQGVHLSKSTFAFASMDDALAAKMAFATATLIEL